MEHGLLLLFSARMCDIALSATHRHAGRHVSPYLCYEPNYTLVIYVFFFSSVTCAPRGSCVALGFYIALLLLVPLVEIVWGAHAAVCVNAVRTQTSPPRFVRGCLSWCLRCCGVQRYVLHPVYPGGSKGVAGGRSSLPRGYTAVYWCRPWALELWFSSFLQAFSILTSFTQNVWVSRPCYSMHLHANDRGYRCTLHSQKGAILGASHATENSTSDGGWTQVCVVPCEM